MKKTMSLVQVEANRANGGKSMGPKTALGKANSRRNALKRGILAREVVLHDPSGGERAGEFQGLHREFWEALEPVGPIEEVLVERMVTAYWRLHRVLVAERGEITTRRSETKWRVDSLGGASAAGLSKAMEVLRQVRGGVEKDGELSAAALEPVREAFGAGPNPLTTALQRVWEDSLHNPESVLTTKELAELSPEARADALRVGRRERMLTFIDREVTRHEWELTDLRKQEAQEAQARRDASFLPSPRVLDKILRYETMLERQFYRAMNQLERLQRARRGEVVPPPLTMEVSGG
jgi:hypothetical protein